jgi:hypothetical protein
MVVILKGLGAKTNRLVVNRQSFSDFDFDGITGFSDFVHRP